MIDRISPTRKPIGVRRVMRQLWRDLLFVHWPVAPDTIQDLLPAGLTVDTFEGCAYIGLVPFSMRGVRPLWSPPVPGLSNFEEINVRTYVHRAGCDPGVWFFSLDATNAIAVSIARLLWQLPYYNARIEITTQGDCTIYRSMRRGGWGGTPDAQSLTGYRALGTPFAATPGTIEHFLVERYLLYAADKRGRLSLGQVHHTPYPVQPAELTRLDDTLVAKAGIIVPNAAPLVHYAHGVDVDIYPLHRI